MSELRVRVNECSNQVNQTLIWNAVEDSQSNWSKKTCLLITISQIKYESAVESRQLFFNRSYWSYRSPWIGKKVVNQQRSERKTIEDFLLFDEIIVGKYVAIGQSIDQGLKFVVKIDVDLKWTNARFDKTRQTSIKRTSRRKTSLKTYTMGFLCHFSHKRD